MIVDLKPYAAYKESVLPWLGRVPVHWDVRPAFGSFMPNHNRNLGMKEKTVLSLSHGRIIIKPPEKLHGLVPESFETYQIVNPGDIILRTTDLQNDHTSLRVGMVRNRGIITSAYLALRVTDGVAPDFGYQYLNVWDMSKAIYGYGSGLRQNLNFSHFKRMPVALPPPAEQAAIVRFLGWANGRLDRAIRAKRKVIALLNEQKQAIIQRIVTRGLDPNIRSKPSDVKWLGDVPEHWEVLRAKYVFREVDERSTTGGEELLSVSHHTGVTPRSEKNITMFKASSYVGHKLCRSGDLVINTMWAWMAALGVSKLTGIISPAYAIYRPRNPERLVGQYLDYLLHTRPYVSNYICLSTGIRNSRLRLYPEHFFKIPIVMPPCEEQRKMVELISSEIAASTNAIASTEQEISLLREYRTRLITDVVTGKLDVRVVAASLPDDADEQKALDETDMLAEYDEDTAESNPDAAPEEAEA